jgi:eukaryotic-like serine/threonine-protein kinase
VPKIMDFSIAEIGPQTQRTRVVQGSPQYMSPEQVRGEALGPQTDLYSLGAVLFQMLAGQPPFPIQDIPQLFTAIKTQPAPSLATLRPDLPPALCEVAERLLLKDQARRFQSGQELASALTRIFDRLRQDDKQLTSREDRDALQRLHFFDSFSDDEVDEVINAATMATYQPGEAIIREGEIDTAFYIIAVGSAEVRKGGKAITRLEKGDCLGEVAFIGASKRSATVTAVTRVLALKIHAITLNDLSRDCQLRFFRVLCETLIFRLSMTSARLSALS